jgi:hypothetical protein
MSNAAICIRWGAPIAGRETKSLEVFNSVLEYNTRLQKEGKITNHHTFLSTTGNQSKFSGLMLIGGDVSQLRAVVDSNEWKTLLAKAQHCVANVEVDHCVTGPEIAKTIERVVTVRKELGITT